MSYLAYKPQVRQDGFHMPHHNGPPSPHNMDAANMFMLPDAFRKFPAVGTHNDFHHGLDFSDDLAQLMAGPNAQSMQMQPHTPSYDARPSTSFDDAYRHTTHNIFDISAPLSASHHPALGGHALPSPATSAPSQSHYPSSFTLNTRHTDLNLLTPGGSLPQGAGPLAEFNKPPSMFNSTLPALNSSMRFEPPPAPASHEIGGAPQAAFQLPPDFRQKHTPSPSTNMNGLSRSRSRSRAPSTGPGPMRTQPTTRAKRNSISSASPPPRPHPSAIMIPGRAQSRDIAHSPLSLNASGGWFAPEFGLPTPDSISSHAGAFGLPARDSSLDPGSVIDEPSPSGGGLSDAAAKQAAIANEKRRRRRESHNAVERRRRDNINEKIGELATLIPECMLDPNAPANFVPTEDQITGAAPMPSKSEDGDPTPTPTLAATLDTSGDSAASKANKGMILRKSVDYIRYLQQLVGAQASRNRVLESELASIRGPRDGSADPMAAGGDDSLRDLVLHDSAFMTDFPPFPFDVTPFTAGGLAVVSEAMDLEEMDDRPSTAMTGISSTRSGEAASPSVDDDSDEYDPQEEQRGRRDRDGRMGGVDLDVPGVRVKTEGHS